MKSRFQSFCCFKFNLYCYAMDLDDLSMYVRELRPRCAHDFKPMCYLLQSLMGHLLAREMDFFSVGLYVCLTCRACI